MILTDVHLVRYRQFVDQRLKVDPRITVLVGRNDTGKTSLLNRFFDQYVYENVVHSSDRPRVPPAGGDVEFRLRWRTTAGDDARYPLGEAFGNPNVNVIDVHFRFQEGPARYWFYRVDGRDVDAYEGITAEGQPIRRRVFLDRRLFPRPYYLSIERPVVTMFEARLYEAVPLPPGNLARPLAEAAEGSLLRLAGLAAETRPLVNDPWPPGFFQPARLTAEELDRRLAELSDLLTERLRRWWTDPPGLRVTVRFVGGAEARQEFEARKTCVISWGAEDHLGLPLIGSGITWFMTFLIDLELLARHPDPLLLLFDEPATPLHPGAQRMAAKLLLSVGGKQQTIYSTHSPFMIDWGYPQRIRLLERDHETRRTTINNTPYHSARLPWDPLREAIGVSVGDVAVLGELNVLVEGVTDQILLANAATALQTIGAPSLDLERTSILPYANEISLADILARAQRLGVRSVVLEILMSRDVRPEASVNALAWLSSRSAHIRGVETTLPLKT